MRLAVLGSPIAHSKSPALQLAAYRALGLDWSYEAIEVTAEALPAFVESRGEEWRGLSLTMPLKRDILPLLDARDDLVTLTGGANTVLFDHGGRSGVTLSGFNSDVFGIVEAFRGAGIAAVGTADVLGGGATAASALAALAQLGARDIRVLVRDPDRSAGLTGLGNRLGVEVSIHSLLVQDRSLTVPDVILSTLPGHSEHNFEFPETVRQTSVLFDVAYDPWPSTFARAWTAAGGTVISGLEMLILQALAQVRIFVNGDPTAELDNEAEVLSAMRAAVAG